MRMRWRPVEPIAPGARVYGVDYPDTQSFAYLSECTAVATECVPMATIVADICRRAGLRTDTSTQIDVSDLTTCVQRLHHRSTDVRARCARAAADVWTVGRG